MNKRIDHSPKKISVVAWQGRAVGVDGAQIDEFREEVHTKLQKVNEYMRNLGGGDTASAPNYSFVDEVVFLPQIMSDAVVTPDGDKIVRKSRKLGKL